MKLRNKKVLLLGATGGIGSAVAAELAEAGARLVLVARDETRIHGLMDNLGDNAGAVEDSFFIDFCNRDAIGSLQDIAIKHPDIDIIVHALGVNSFESYDRIDDDKLHSMFSVNVFSLMHVARALMPNLVDRDNGQLLVIGSTFGSIGFPGFSNYSASKFALRGYVESLRRELAATSVDVLYVAPRATNTELNDARIVAMNRQLGNVMDAPAAVAKKVMTALHRKTLNSYIGWPEKLFVRINAINSKLVDKGISKKLPLITRLLAE